MKIYTYLITIISVFFLSIHVWNAWYNNGSEEISWEKTFKKQHGRWELRVHEDYYINPFDGVNIVKNTTCSSGGSNCSSTYMVWWKFFSDRHSLFKRSWSIRKGLSQESDGIKTMVMYLEDTFIKEGVRNAPKTKVLVRKYYIVNYNFDTTSPTCWDVELYDDEQLTQQFTYAGWWLNSPKYYTMVCEDPETWCFCDTSNPDCQVVGWRVLSNPEPLGHKQAPSATFTNNVLLTGQCSASSGYREVLYDTKVPRLDIILWGEDLRLNSEDLRVYKKNGNIIYDGIQTPWKTFFSRSWSIDFLAAQRSNISLSIEDTFTSGSAHGVSWIQSYDFSLVRKTNTSFENIPSQKINSCSKTQSFPQYNPSWNIEVSNKKNINIPCNNLHIAGRYHLVFNATDWAGNETRTITIINVYPNDISPSTSLLSVSSLDDKYANNEDVYTYTLELKDRYSNPIFNKNLNAITQNIDGYNGWKTLKTVSNSLALLSQKISSNTNKNGVYKFTLKSLLPGEYTQRFKLWYNFWDSSYARVSETREKYIAMTDENTFKKPFVWDIIVTWPGDKPQVWKLQNYKITLANPWNIKNISQWNASILKNTIPFVSGHKFEVFSNIDNRFSLVDPTTWFRGQINVLNASSALQAPDITIDKLPISYRVWGQTVRYILDTFWIVWCDLGTLGLKVIGNIQGDGKSDITGQQENFSDISTSSLRSNIRQNAYNLIRGQKSGTIINRVKYVEGNIRIQWNPNTIGNPQWYETLIVRNGNVFINWNLNTSQNKFWIIVLRDSWYDLSKDYKTSGNIFIGNNVSNIYGAMYADGALISAKLDGSSYSDSELWQQLDFKWVLFTRNTIGGAVDAWWNLLLPWWWATTDKTLAQKYDLNYIRKPQLCGVDDYAFKVEYDPNIQLDPPKGFQK